MPDKKYISVDRHAREVRSKNQKIIQLEKQLEKIQKGRDQVVKSQQDHYQGLKEATDTVAILNKIVQSLPTSCPNCGQHPLIRYDDLPEDARKWLAEKIPEDAYEQFM